MHEKYTTEGFVVGSRASREADKILRVYTRDFGMVSGVLMGVRNIRSKLKGFTDTGLQVEVTLVKGKNAWRITDMQALPPFRLSTENLPSFLRLLSLLSKLVQGEEKNEDLFESLSFAFQFLSKRKLSSDSLGSLELIGALRILDSLGYGHEAPKNISIKGNITDADLLKTAENRPEITRSINQALSESQLMHKI